MFRILAYVGWLVFLFGCRTEPLAPGFQKVSSESNPSGSPPDAVSHALRCMQLEDDIKAKFEAFLSRHRACKDSADCTLVNTDCPLGCYGVAASKRAMRQAKVVSDGLLELFEGLDCGCVYKCSAPDQAECVNGKCVGRATSPGAPG